MSRVRLLRKFLYLMVSLSFVIGLTIGSSSHVGAQQATIPSWVKNTALWWGKGQIGDSEFLKAIQWMVDNGLIHISASSGGNPQSQTQSSGSIQSSTGFSPCPEVNLTTASECLARFLPTPADIGTQWSTHNGADIPSGIHSSLMTQMVREDFENLSAKPLEIFDVWVEEYKTPEQGQSVFKLNEQTMENGATKFFGSSKSNDTSFICICPDGSGGTAYESEFVAGSVVVKVDGIGNSKNVITDMGMINKIILANMIQKP